MDRSTAPKIGQTVLAEVNGEYMVRRLGEQALIAANPSFPVLAFAEIEQLAIIGVVTGSMRKFK